MNQQDLILALSLQLAETTVEREQARSLLSELREQLKKPEDKNEDDLQV